MTAPSIVIMATTAIYRQTMQLDTGLEWFWWAISYVRDSQVVRRGILGEVSDEWVTQMLRQGDAQVMKKYSQMKRNALEKLNRLAGETAPVPAERMCTVVVQ
jgi:hypothetical protein